MLSKKILILEDDLKTVAALLESLSEFFVLDKETGEMERVNCDVTAIADSRKATVFLRELQDEDFDLILLDRDCCSRESFHSIDFNKFSPDKIIAISSVSEYNQELVERYGITRRVEKRLGDPKNFADQVVRIAVEVLGGNPPVHDSCN